MSLEAPFSAVWLVGADPTAAGTLQPAAETLASFGIGAETVGLIAGEPAANPGGGVCAIIVASPDAALPAALAARTGLPVIRVPTEAAGRSGLALLSDGAGNLPAGPPEGGFATVAVGPAGAKNAALFVVSSLALQDARLRAAWAEFRARQTGAVRQHPPLEL